MQNPKKLLAGNHQVGSHGRWPRTLTVLASLTTLAGAASAQSGVTMYGIVDMSVAHGTGSVADRTQLFSGSLLGSRLGFRGTEDLGGGMAASFVLEAGLNGDSGTGAPTNTNNQATGAALPGLAGGQGLTFNRISYVALSGGWGQVRLGRDYTPTFVAQAAFDPDSIGSGLWAPQSAVGSLVTLAHPAGVRASNSIGYYLPKMGGFTGQLMYATGENPSNAGATQDDGNLMGVRLGYNLGAFDVGIATETIKAAAVGDLKHTVLGASYNFGVAKLWAQAVRDTTELANKMDGLALAVSAPLGAAELRAGWSRSKVKNQTGAVLGTTDKIALVGIYNLSKRTAVYTTLAQSRNKDGASAVPLPGVALTGPNTNARAYEVGVRHIF